jgi:hypothetical protein
LGKTGQSGAHPRRQTQAIKARDRYNQVYGSRNVGGYPQSIHMQFVPDIPCNQKQQNQSRQMMAKQRVFLANTKLISTTTIAGIPIAIPRIGFTLCQVLMAIKLIDFPDIGLFISIAENFVEGSYTVLFTVHKDQYDKDNSLVPLLCIILEATFGQCVWEWFTDDAKRVLTKYTWNASEERVVLIHSEDDDDGMDLDSNDDYMKSICDMLNIDEEMAEMGSILTSTSSSKKQDAQQTNTGILVASRPSVTHSTRMGVPLLKQTT